jgi:hypothetical protein
MENVDCKLPTLQECPCCGWPTTIADFNDGECPKCNKKYRWVTVGQSNAESNDTGHDYVTWR